MNNAIRLASDGQSRPMPRKLNFTRAALAEIRCPPGKSLVAVYDLRAPNLLYIVRASGARAFYWYGRVRGEPRPVRHYIGGDEFPIDNARLTATETTVKARKGVNPNGEITARRRAARTRRRMVDLWNTYRAEYLDVRARPKTLRTHVSTWQTWLADTIGNRELDKVDADTIRNLHATIAKGKVLPKEKGRGRGRRTIGGKRTANKAVALLSRIFNYNRVPSPITRGTVELFPQHARERFLGPAEAKAFFQALSAEADTTARDFLELAIYTGARRGNIESMRWDEIDLTAGTWTIPGTKTKRGKPIAIPLVPPAAAILARRKADNDKLVDPSPFVLASDDTKTGHIVEPWPAMRRILKAAGIKGLTIHDLRRTLGSWAAATGASLPIIGRALGHQSQASTQIYARLDLDPVRTSVTNAVEALRTAAGIAPAAKEPTKGGRKKQPK